MTPHRDRRRHNERGSGTILTLLMSLLLLVAVAIATIWSAVSTARHKLAAAADLTALSAAQAIQSATSDPCAVAGRIATIHHVQLAKCQITGDTVAIQVATHLDLASIAHPTLTTTARAGPT
jgi:secretion/DNA translocation related TadE-like protein